MALKGHSAQITTVRAEGDLVYAASMDKTVRIWDSRSGGRPQEPTGLWFHASSLTAIALDPCTALCIGAREYPCSVTSLCSLEGVLATGLVNGTCSIVDARTLKVLPPRASLCFASPAGRRVLILAP